MSYHSFSSLGTVDHMTHINNLEGILSQGLLAHDNDFKQVDISNKAVNKLRSKAEPVYGKSIHEYVPFYFNPRNPMLYANRDEHVIVLGFNIRIISTEGAIFTDGNASRKDTSFSNDTVFLEQLNWDHVFSRRWHSYGHSNESIKSSMMSELLIPDSVSVDYLEIIFCKSAAYKEYILENYFLTNIDVVVAPHLFF